MEILLNNLYDWMYQGVALLLFASFLWGVASILLSPCHLASIPLIIGFINDQKNKSVKKSFMYALVFSTGILFSLIIIGYITVLAGRIAGDIGSWPGVVIGVVFVFVGLYLMGLMDFSWNSINVSKIKLKGYFAAMVLGIILGVGLGPCTFAFMAPVLGVVFENSDNLPLTTGIILSFATGHCGVIVFAGGLTNSVEKYLQWSEDCRAVIMVKKVCGVLVILGGIYLVWKNAY